MAAPRELAPGEYLTASWLNRLLRWVLKLRAISFLPPLYASEGADGTIVVRYAGPDEADFLVTGGGSGGVYAGAEAEGGAGGSWAVLPGGRVADLAADPLYERNGKPGVDAGVAVRARRERATGRWVFEMWPCS